MLMHSKVIARTDTQEHNDNIIFPDRWVVKLNNFGTLFPIIFASYLIAITPHVVISCQSCQVFEQIPHTSYPTHCAANNWDQQENTLINNGTWQDHYETNIEWASGFVTGITITLGPLMPHSDAASLSCVQRQMDEVHSFYVWNERDESGYFMVPPYAWVKKANQKRPYI